AAETDWRTEDPSAKRDSLMADNLFWLMNEIYPGKKVVVWAHNGHIDRQSAMGNPYTWMGHFIGRKMGSSSMHIGLFAREGETFEWWTKTNKPFNNNQPNDVEQLSAIYPITFTVLNNKQKNCSWAGKPLFGFELENGGRLQFVPAKRFDAVISLQKVTLPTYR
ncbi:MAG: erythromycin esterase family protein, partial [Dinghuibacter sp.]|nr:erythromycin esterase family protein [Dinghuibacter sp.]